jgi:hypothetical protein
MITRRAHVRRPSASRALPASCPSCGWHAESDADKSMLRDELLTEWWAVDPLTSSMVTTSQQYCHHCRPVDVYLVACLACGDGPLLAGELATLALTNKPALPPLVADVLTENGWRQLADVRGKGPGWVCCR